MGSADRVLVATDPRFVSATADIYATALHRAIEAEKPDLTIIGYTAAGMDFGPEAATRVGLPMAANVVALQRNADGVSIRSQIYGGKMIAHLQAPGPALVMVSPGAYVEAPSVPLDSSRISTLDVSSAPEFGKIELIEEIAPALADVDLTTAERIVCVGRGIGDEKSIASPASSHAFSAPRSRGAAQLSTAAGCRSRVRWVNLAKRCAQSFTLRSGYPALRSTWKAWRRANSSLRSTQIQARRSSPWRIFRPTAICLNLSTV